MSGWIVGLVVYMLVMSVAYTVRLVQIERGYRRTTQSLRDFTPRERVLDLTPLSQVTFEQFIEAIFAEDMIPTEVRLSPAGWASFVSTVPGYQAGRRLGDPLDLYRHFRELGLTPCWGSIVRLTVPEVDAQLGLRSVTEDLERGVLRLLVWVTGESTMVEVVDRRPVKPCDVCGAPAVTVNTSAVGPVAFAYCQSCAESDQEPLWAVVASLYGIESWEDIDPDYIPVVEASMKAAGWDRERLLAEVRKFEREFEQELGGIHE